MKRLDRKLDGVSMTITKLKLMSSKSICDIQIIAITELKMTVELPVNITKPLYDDIPVY